MRATLKQIAVQAGVSIGTVDRVMHNRSGVNEQTAALVRSVAKALNYQANTAGRALTKQRKPLKIGTIVSNPNYNRFAEEVVKGIEDGAESLADFGIDYSFYGMSSFNVNEQLRLLEEASKANLEGLVIRPVNHPSVRAAIDELAMQGTAVVTLVSDIENSKRLCFVGNDQYLEGRKTASLILKLLRNEPHIAIVTGSTQMLSHHLKIQGFKDYILEKAPESNLLGTFEISKNIEATISILNGLREHYPLNALLIQSVDRSGISRIVEDLDLPDLVTCAYGAAVELNDLVMSRVLSFAIDENPRKQGRVAMRTIFDYLFNKVSPGTDSIAVETPIILDV